jgi:uncharacterized protein involved in outer membrane biogenesis
MSRAHIKQLKRAITRAGDSWIGTSAQSTAKVAALTLLQRSITFRHGRLALVRLKMALQVGADIQATHWLYCESAANESEDQQLQALLAQAKSASSALADQLLLRGELS